MNLNKKVLLKSEWKQYEEFGEPDMNQNWLELFDEEVVDDLFTIMRGSSNNPGKAKRIAKEMEYCGFEEVGLGTNIFVMSNPIYPGVVFKFALDDYGIADNFNDPILCERVNEILGEQRYTRMLARLPSGIISVQERKVVIRDQDRMDVFRKDIIKALNKLAPHFLIIDLSPTYYNLNYGINRDGSWCFIDGSDLYPLASVRKEDITCHKAVGYDDKKKKVIHCNGDLTYNHDFSRIVCSKCGLDYIPSEIRKDDKEGKKKMAKIMLDGTTAEERDKMRREEMAVLIGKPIPKPIKFQYDDEDDDDDYREIEEEDEPPVVVQSPRRKSIFKPFVKQEPKRTVQAEVRKTEIEEIKVVYKEPEPEELDDDEDDDEDDETVDVVAVKEAIQNNLTRIPSPPDVDDEDLPNISYELITESDDGSEGLYINLRLIPGTSISKPLEDIIPIWLSIDDGETWNTLASRSNMMKLIETKIIEDLGTV